MFATVSRHTMIRHELRLPVRGEVLVAPNDRVEPGQVVARTIQYDRIQVLNVGAALRIRDDELIACLLIGMGDPVKSGEVIARYKRGWLGRSYRSPVTGRISAILNGRLLVEANPQTVEVTSCLPGRVAQIIPGFGAVIECEAGVIEGAWATGDEASGLLKVLASAAEEPLTADRIDATAQGCILVGGLSVDEAVLKKAVQHKARGLVIGSASSATMGRFESMPFPVMLTEGFGTIPMAEPVLEFLRQAEGQQACLSVRGVTRDPVARPRLILPGHAGSDLDQSGDRMMQGSTVRVVRDPHLGKIGRIKSIQLTPRSIESGSPQPVAEIETAPGEVVVVPLRNLEPIG